MCIRDSTIPINPKAANGGATIGAVTTGVVIAVMGLTAAIALTNTKGNPNIIPTNPASIWAVVAARASAVCKANPPDTTGKFTEMNQEVTDNSNLSSIFTCTSWAVIFAHTESRSPYSVFKENFCWSAITSSYIIIKLTLSTGTKIVVRIQLK